MLRFSVVVVFVEMRMLLNADSCELRQGQLPGLSSQLKFRTWQSAASVSPISQAADYN